MSNPQQTGISGNVLVVAIAAMFVALVAAAVALAIGLDDSQNPAGIIAILLASFATLVTSLASLYGVSKVSSRVERTGQLVDDLANGTGDAKVKAAVHDALDERRDR